MRNMDRDRSSKELPRMSKEKRSEAADAVQLARLQGHLRQQVRDNSLLHPAPRDPTAAQEENNLEIMCGHPFCWLPSIGTAHKVHETTGKHKNVALCAQHLWYEFVSMQSRRSLLK